MKVQHQDDRIAFHCPGCGDIHSLPVEGEHAWQWNGSLDLPTLTPSILARHGHYVPGHAGGCWCTYRQEHPDCPYQCGVCHSYVTDGRIAFLGDCTHSLAGQTVDLLDWDEH